jgi:hypothetical protein
MFRIHIAAAALVFGFASAQSAGAQPSTTSPHDDAISLIALADRLSAQDLWPGFNPKTIPVAVFDGERTFLFGHPSPPAGFEPLGGNRAVLVMQGRTEQVTANSSALIGGVQTATLMPPSAGASLRNRAGVLLHEKFHVFQREHHKGWSANEAELFAYPFSDTAQITMQREELEAVQRALLANRAKGSCWAKIAMDVRARRLAMLPNGAAQFERMTELNEGLATYVEKRAVGIPDRSLVTETRFAPDLVRFRAYQSGVGIARLLDRYSPRWRSTLESNDSTALDVLLATALSSTPRGSCDFSPAERARFHAESGADVAALVTRRETARREFVGREGWSLSIVSAESPLFPQGFDPLNVQVVTPAEVLHSRFVKLGNAAGSIQVLGRASLTEASGAHPLFNGVKRLTVTGLSSAPDVSVRADTVTIKADGISGEFRGGAVQRENQRVTVTLSNPAKR